MATGKKRGRAGGQGRRDSYGREKVRTHDESRAEALLVAGLTKLELKEGDLDCMIMDSPEKYALAWRVRKS